MPEAVKTRVFMSGRSQHVTIPAAFRFTTEEVYIESDPASGKLILSEEPPKRPIEEVFRDLDACDWSDFVIERQHSLPPEREPL